MGIFSKETFLQAPVKGANDTVRTPITPGVYEGVVVDVDVRNGEKDGREWAQLVVKFELLDDDLKVALKRDRVMVTYDFFIDLTDVGTIDLDDGKNVTLGRLRKAVGLNEAGFFPAQLVGARCLVSVYNQPVKDSPDGDMRSLVRGVAAIA